MASIWIPVSFPCHSGKDYHTRVFHEMHESPEETG